MSSLIEMIREIARLEVDKKHTLELGVIETVNIHNAESDVVNFDCSVLLKGRLTGEGEPLKLENVPMSTDHSGTVKVPYVNDLVLVSFLNGDIALPVILGTIHSKEKRAPIYAEGEHRTVFDPRTFRKDDGANVDKRIISFRNPSETSGLCIEFDKGPVVNCFPSKVEVVAGKTRLCIDMDGNVTVECEKNVGISVKGNIEMKAEGDVLIEAGGNVNVKGTKINLN